ncbi:YicC/YloC family endoribonuclease [Salinihabitans flavidus]|nr:YicC/YloC family endoribonuclease [Salinihabitans flavidus]
MTGFASARGTGQGLSWSWDLRSVNARGLDLRVRVPDWIEGLEPALRARLGKALSRGSVTLSLRLGRDEGAGGAATINPAALDAMLLAVRQTEARAAAQGVTLAPTRAADILALRGVMEADGGETDAAALRAQLLEELEPLLAAFVENRRREGIALETVLSQQVTRIAELTEQAAQAAEERRAEMQGALRANLARVMENTDGMEPDRVAQELALIAVKADVTEEIDRLRAHVDAARDLLEKGSPAGRKLDFLMQEFNREANTLCAKAQAAALTSVGLELKVVIDQMREQVQNVE